MIVILDQGRFHTEIVYTIIFGVQQCLLAGLKVRAGCVLSMRLIITTTIWLWRVSGSLDSQGLAGETRFPEGQSKGHADLTSALHPHSAAKQP